MMSKSITIEKHPNPPLRLHHKVVGKNKWGIIMEMPEINNGFPTVSKDVCGCCKYWDKIQCIIDDDLHSNCVKMIGYFTYYK